MHKSRQAIAHEIMRGVSLKEGQDGSASLIVGAANLYQGLDFCTA
jgi:hypothetical protein